MRTFEQVKKEIDNQEYCITRLVENLVLLQNELKIEEQRLAELHEEAKPENCDHYA